jgi:hypothetical protein
MIKSFISKIVFSKRLSMLYIIPLLKLHNLLYKLITKVSAIITIDRLHPKHKILMYKEWFNQCIKSNDVVLDVGSNTGELPVFLSNKAKYVYGIEIVERLHNKALERDNISNVEFILGDATSYNYSKIRPISIVTLSNVLEHIEHRVEFLKGITENLSWEDEKNRKLLIRVPMMDRDWITIYKKNMGVEWRLDLTHYTEYTMDSFLQEMNEAGILVLESDVRFGEIYAVCSIKN